MSRRLGQMLVITGFALLVGGCATGPVAPDAAATHRTTHASFEMEGRLSASDGERAANGRMLWIRTRDRDEWSFLSPLGQTLATLVSTPSGALLTTADGQRMHANDPAELLPELLGVSAPVESLPYWIQATTADTGRVLLLDEKGRPTRISDEGWILDYPEYADDSPDAPPRRIEARWGDSRIRLIIDQWIPGS